MITPAFIRRTQRTLGIIPAVRLARAVGITTPEAYLWIVLYGA